MKDVLQGTAAILRLVTTFSDSCNGSATFSLAGTNGNVFDSIDRIKLRLHYAGLRDSPVDSVRLLRALSVFASPAPA